MSLSTLPQPMEQRIRRTNDAITPFTLAVPQADLEDLNRRIDQTRWPDAETVDDWTQGAPLAKVKALVDHWRHRYDGRRCEAMLNDWGQYKTAIDGLDIHFLHVRSKHENAMPLIITHGWPGSVIEFMKIIGPLTDPTAHGGKAEAKPDPLQHPGPGGPLRRLGAASAARQGNPRLFRQGALSVAARVPECSLGDRPVDCSVRRNQVSRLLRVIALLDR